MKTSKKLNKLFDKYKSQILKAVLVLLLIPIFFRHKSLIIILVFEILDWTKNAIKHAFPYFPVEVRFIFGITASYYYSPFIGIIIFILGIINRTVLHLDIMHIFKAIRHIPLFFLVSFLRLPFFQAAMIALVLNYVMKYLVNIAKDAENVFDSIIYLFANFFVAMILFYLIEVLYSYFPWLA